MGKKHHNPKAANQEGQSSEGYHVPVLLNEAIHALNIKPDGIYVDCTFGGGGHSKAILNKLGPTGKLVAFDQDIAARDNLPADNRLIYVPSNFRHLQRFLRMNRIEAVDGVLADLGVSSHQFDEAERGFSIRFDAELDMRMDQRTPLKAADVVATYSEQQLHQLFEKFGEVTNSKTLAKRIVELRSEVPMKTINQFKAALQGIVKGNPNKYFAQVFQALRIEVNDDLLAPLEMLQQLPRILKKGGRVAIITFHSLEDRLVKVYFREGSFEKDVEHPFENRIKIAELTIVNKKPILPDTEEMKRNPRARSAKLRIAEKIV